MFYWKNIAIVKKQQFQNLQVETIGDAYMVVAGVPDITDQHAALVAEQAMDMVAAAQEVVSPVTGKPLQVRRESPKKQSCKICVFRFNLLIYLPTKTR